MTKEKQSLPPQGELLVYQTDDGQVKLDVRLENESLWLSLNQMASLFGVDKSGVSRHLKNIFETGELVRDSVVAKTATTAADGKVYQVEYFNLDAIISVGYRVNSILGTRFRIWATERLRESIVKGFMMDDDRLKELGGGRMTRGFSATLSSLRAGKSVKRVGHAFRLPVSGCKRNACSALFKKSRNHTLIGMEQIPEQRILKKEAE